MREVVLNEAIEARKVFLEIYDHGFIGFLLGIQMRSSAFLDAFQEYTVSAFDSKDYPWELSAEYNGEKFFALVNEEEVARYDIQIPKEEL